MTLDYGLAVSPYQVPAPDSRFSCVGLRNGQVKLLSFQARLFDVRQQAEAIPLHRPKQHVICLHHFEQPMKLERNLNGRNRRETSGTGDIAFLPADAPAMLRFGKDDPEQLVSYSYLVFEPSYIADLALSNGIGGPLDFIPTFSTPDPFLHEITSALASPRIKDPAGNLFVESLLNAACARILRTYASVRYPLSGPPRLTDDQLRRAIDYIQDHIREALDLGSIARAAGLSAFHFARLFKAATGDTPFKFVTRTRMDRAKELLRKTRLPISEIAERVGYQQPSHFSARFRSVLGCRPDAYRKSTAR
ncbi:MAG: helix-turn-helix transcriptional regulator [Verrucomicrobia bacterium]|nr:helix-turn-helix transcriptional regulator [Verrucomicrobiota bacterium]